MAWYEKLVDQGITSNCGGEVFNEPHFEGIPVDLDIGEIIKILQIRKGAIPHFLYFRRLKLTVPVHVKIIDDHAAEHFIENPFNLESCQAFFVENDFDGIVDEHMGMVRRTGWQAKEEEN